MDEHTTTEQALTEIIDSISRRKGNFSLTAAPPRVPGLPEHEQPNQPFMLQLGSWRAITVGKKTGQQGYLVMLGISRERLTELRDLCNKLLALGN